MRERELGGGGGKGGGPHYIGPLGNSSVCVRPSVCVCVCGMVEVMCSAVFDHFRSSYRTFVASLMTRAVNTGKWP